MRVSREQAEKNHQAVINTASHMFRERGFDGIGLIELMEGAGLTKGGFYKQFASKEDLAAQASRRSMEMAIDKWSRMIATKPDTPLEAVVELYLSTEHCAAKGDGCPLVALGADAARQGPEIKDSFEGGVKKHLEVLNDILPIADGKARAEKAAAILSLMVGALTLARVVNDKRLSRAFLDTAAKQIRLIAEC